MGLRGLFSENLQFHPSYPTIRHERVLLAIFEKLAIVDLDSVCKNTILLNSSGMVLPRCFVTF